MNALNEKHVYDLSELTSEERQKVSEVVKNPYVAKEIEESKYLVYSKSQKHWQISDRSENPTNNAKELFYTLENIQVDCRYLTEEQIDEMADVYKNNGFRIGSLYLSSVYYFLNDNNCNYCLVNTSLKNKTTITYNKFMELFGNKEKTEEFNNLVDVSNEELTEEYNNSQFKQIANSLADLLEYKNKMYGNSALEPLNIFNNKCKVGQRLDDKLARIKNSNELRKNDICDLIGYLILTCKENNWTNFDEFKD